MSKEHLKTAFLVYRPVMNYEESMTPYFFCETKEQADAAAQKMCDYAQRLTKKLPVYTREEEEQDTDSSVWSEKDEKRRDILAKARWPFGVNLQYDISGFYDQEFDPSCVQVMELPIVK